jgi:hypothetical protein
MFPNVQRWSIEQPGWLVLWLTGEAGETLRDLFPMDTIATVSIRTL